MQSDEFAFLDKFGAWMTLNGEAIYSTRPWKTDGEGPTQGAGGSLHGGPARRFVAGDIRFTAKGDALYAIALALNSPHYRGEIARIGLLGSESNLVWSRNAYGVTISLPEKPPCDYAYVFKIDCPSRNPGSD
jgi:alpha-L-fucosidase